MGENINPNPYPICYARQVKPISHLLCKAGKTHLIRVSEIGTHKGRFKLSTY